MTRFEVTIEEAAGKKVYLLRDMHTGALARILPELGANCMQLHLAPGEDEKPVAVIDDMAFMETLKTRPSSYGIPILFPWPSGIPGGEFQFDDRIVKLNEPGNDKSRHHGFVKTAEWRVVRSDCDNTGAWVTCSINSADCGNLASKYPSQFIFEITWKLHADGFQMIMTARNTGDESMPFGVGLHPYFTIPFGKSGSRQTCRLAADVGRQWDLDAIMATTTGDAAPAEIFLPRPEFDPSPDGGTPLGDEKFNHVYAAGFDERGVTRASVIDPATGLQLSVSATRDFGVWVFYTPPNRSAISLEPWTLAPNGFNLAAAGIDAAGMKSLEPGHNWTGQVDFNCSRIAKTD